MKAIIGISAAMASAVAFADLSADEAKLKAMLPDVFAKSAAHYRAIDAAATPLMNAGDVKEAVPHGDKPPREVVGAADGFLRAVDDVRDEPARIARPRERPRVRSDPRHRVRQPVADIVRERLVRDRVRG